MAMNLLVIRHAIAQDRGHFAKARPGEDDSLRPLTARGRTRMRLAAKGLHRIAPGIDLLATSPLTRAVQTGDIVAAVCGDPKRVEISQLAPGQPLTGLLRWLQSQRSDRTIALVGHEPQLGVFAGWLLTGLQDSFLRMKKGAACLLRFKADVKAGRATLIWSLAPSQLRLLGR